MAKETAFSRIPTAKLSILPVRSVNNATLVMNSVEINASRVLLLVEIPTAKVSKITYAKSVPKEQCSTKIECASL